jgi:glycosyltransferase involved in cell wall biosynthesis
VIGEVIVADHSSGDETLQIARQAGCRIVSGGEPAVGRNAGAKTAREEYLLFTDADVLFSPRVPRLALEILRQHASVSAVHFRVRPLGGGWIATFAYSVLASYTRVTHLLGMPQGVGSFIAVRRRAFDSIGGFREDLAAGEDADFIRRIAATGQVWFEESLCVVVSARRLSLERPLVFAAFALRISSLTLTVSCDRRRTSVTSMFRRIRVPARGRRAARPRRSAGR